MTHVLPAGEEHLASATAAPGATARFKSTAAFALRSRRTATAVERATFVLFSAGDVRCAIPVEVVERVLRHDSPMDAVERVLRPDAHHDRTTVQHGGRTLAVIDVALQLGVTSALGVGATDDVRAGDTRRLLVIALATGAVAARVDAVHEVASVDASLIGAAVPREARAPLLRGARASFVRHAHRYTVLDVARVLGGSAA